MKQASPLNPATNTDFKRFPFNNFTCYLTLFSKCFSSFLHSTCSLSVSCQYLALDEIYHPFRAAFPNNPTLWKCITWQRHDEPKTGFSPSLMPHSKETWTHMVTENTSSNYNSGRSKPPRFQIWAFPCSLAVTGGILVSFFSSAYWYA